MTVSTVANAGHFKKGNQLAKGKREQPFAAMLRIAIKEAGLAEGTTKLRDVADMLVKEAAAGNIQAIKELADRLDGKPVQQQILSGDPDAPLRTISTEAPKAEDWLAKYGVAANQD